MSNIYFGFSAPIKTKVFAELLKWWMGKEYSHGYVKFESDTVPSSIYQASHGMVHFMSLNNFYKSNKVVIEYAVPITIEQRRLLLSKCIDRAGNKYSYVTLLKVFIYDLFKTTSADQGGEEICSELQAELLRECLGITFNKPTHLCRPDDVENKLKELYGKN